MTNLEALILTNNNVGGTIHQFAKVLGVNALWLASADLSELAESKRKGDFDSLKQASFLRQCVMNQKGILLNGKVQTTKHKIL